MYKKIIEILNKYEECQDNGLNVIVTNYGQKNEIAQELVKLLGKPVVNGSASDFEIDLYKLINAHCKKGLKKPDLVHKMQYVTKSCELS